MLTKSSALNVNTIILGFHQGIFFFFSDPQEDMNPTVGGVLDSFTGPTGLSEPQPPPLQQGRPPWPLLSGLGSHVSLGLGTLPELPTLALQALLCHGLSFAAAHSASSCDRESVCWFAS